MSDFPRPLYFMSRGNGVLTPLIAADELPSFLKIVGVPATMAVSETTNMHSLGETIHTGKLYDIELTGTSPTNALEKLSPQMTGAQTAVCPVGEDRAPKKRFQSPDAGMFTDNMWISGAKDIENWRQGVTTIDDTQAVIDEVVAANQKQDIINQEQAPVPVVAPQSRTEAAATPGIYGKKVYCTYWLKTGNCHYQQQGCLYKHEMPDNKTLSEIGIGRRPDWHIKQFGYDWKPEKAAAIEQPWRAPTAQELPGTQQARPAPLPAMNGFGRGQGGFAHPSLQFLPLTSQQQNSPAARSPGFHASNFAAQRSPARSTNSLLRHGYMPTPATTTIDAATAISAPVDTVNTYNSLFATAPAFKSTAATAAVTTNANATNTYIAPSNRPTAIYKHTAPKQHQPLPLTSSPPKPHIPSPHAFPVHLCSNDAPKPMRHVDNIKSLMPSIPTTTKSSNLGPVAKPYIITVKSSSTAAAAGSNTSTDMEKAKAFEEENIKHRRYFVAPGESAFVQNSKEQKPRRVVADDWMVRVRKMAAEKQIQDAVHNGNGSGAGGHNSNGAAGVKVMNGNGNGHGNGQGNVTANTNATKPQTAPPPVAKTSSKNPPGKNPTTGKNYANPKNKTPKAKPGVKGRGQTGAKVLDKEDAVVEDLLVDFEG